MGATLPVAARWLSATPKGLSWVGLLYSGNIAGAVLGSLLAGFYLLRVHDMITATLVAAALGGGIAASAFLLSILERHATSSDHDDGPAEAGHYVPVDSPAQAGRHVPDDGPAQAGHYVLTHGPAEAGHYVPVDSPAQAGRHVQTYGPAKAGRHVHVAGRHGQAAVYLAIGLSGCCALAAEVIWTRLLSLLLGGTIERPPARSPQGSAAARD